jgi:S1-C subfamily serine protease
MYPRASTVPFLAGLLAVLLTTSASAQSLADVFARVSGAVVVVYTETTDYQLRGQAVAVSVPGTGSGVLISTNQVLTAAHVVQAADRVVIVFPNGDEHTASVVGSSETHDVALLRLDRPVSVPPAVLGDSNAMAIGEEVFVVGAPLGESHTLTVGHLSARRQRAGLLGTSSVEFLQTDASINPGNSGGPMFNMNGEVVGIVSHILTETGGSVGLGYAVAANTAREVLLEQRAWWSGLSATPVAGPLAALLNLPPPGGGLMVQHIAKGSFAESLALQPAVVPITIAGQEFKVGGDVIVEVQGIPFGARLENAERIRAALTALPPNSIVRIKVLRGGEIVELAGTIPPS